MPSYSPISSLREEITAVRSHFEPGLWCLSLLPTDLPERPSDLVVTGRTA